LPMAEAAHALELAAARGIELTGGPPEVDYLRGTWQEGNVPIDTTADLKPIVPSRRPLLRTIVSTARFSSWSHLPANLIAPTHILAYPNPSAIDRLRKERIRFRYADAGTLFLRAGSHAPRLPETIAHDVAEAGKHLAQCFVDATEISSPYRDRLLDLVNAKISRILRRCAEDMHRLRDAQLPDHLWGNSGGQYAVRAVSIEMHRRGGSVALFAHAGSSVMVQMREGLAMREMAVCDELVVHTPTLAAQPEILDAAKAVASIRSPRLMGMSGDPSLANLPLDGARMQASRPRVIYAPTLLRGFERNGIKPLPDTLYLDWQIRIARFLEDLPIEFVCKPHPGGYFKGKPHPIEKIATTRYERFEELMEWPDVFVFDSLTTTTIWEALCSDRRVVYIDMGLFHPTRLAAGMLDRRATILPAHYDERNRPDFDPDELREAVLASGRPDSGEFRAHLVSSPS
jgi:hypothetical protein